MSTRYSVLQSTNGPLIEMRVELRDLAVPQTCAVRVLDANDASLRAVLVRLGWTPPAASVTDEGGS